MRAHHFDVFQRNPRLGEQMVLHRQKMFGDDVKARARQQMVDVSDPPGQGIFDRQHGALSTTLRHRFHRLIKGAARQRGKRWRILLAGELRKCPRLALIRDPFF